MSWHRAQVPPRPTFPHDQSHTKVGAAPVHEGEGSIVALRGCGAPIRGRSLREQCWF
jgi:hypothetical protein